MKKTTRTLGAIAVTAGLVIGGAVAAAPANAMSGTGIRTVACGAGKTAQIDWKSTGTVNLFSFNTNAPYAADTLERQVTKNGSYSWNSGRSTLHWGFGVSPGNVTSYTERCVLFN
jgi:hypothetical protein